MEESGRWTMTRYDSGLDFARPLDFSSSNTFSERTRLNEKCKLITVINLKPTCVLFSQAPALVHQIEYGNRCWAFDFKFSLFFLHYSRFYTEANSTTGPSGDSRFRLMEKPLFRGYVFTVESIIILVSPLT